ncbi:hypothetical protein EYC80_010408 [Monilinia laxa]|uniref:Uncharacterized protein n=1 Tax=Monilinia laxa TaxID=61186 RepID=A0A5N6JQT8_MONLA|nr:hypothetical protein EYC80_010408 [Monilinia laxa]
MLGLSPQIPFGASKTQETQHGLNNATSSICSTPTTKISLSAIPEEGFSGNAPPEYFQDGKMTHNIFPSYTSESDDEPDQSRGSRSPVPISYAKSLFSMRSITVKKQGENVAGRMVGKIRKFIAFMDEKAEKHAGGNETTWGTESTSPVSLNTPSISEYSVSSEKSGNSSDKDPWCLGKYLSTPDPHQQNCTLSDNETESPFVGKWGYIVRKNLNDSKVIEEDLPSTNPMTSFPRDIDGTIWKANNVLSSRNSFNSSLTITGTVTELNHVSELTNPGLIVPNSSGQYDRNLHDTSEHWNQQEVSDKIIPIKEDFKHIPRLIDSRRDLDIVITDMWKHKHDWDRSQNLSGESKTIDHGEWIIQRKYKR